jgi:RNA polymerase sigma factor for flagellar operon FliA
MQRQPITTAERQRIVAGLPFVEALARRMAASMPHSIDIGDLVQDGVIGLIDAAHRFDAQRGIKFETFAERRVRGAMIDALRRDAWPRGVRRVRRELEAAREALRRELGHEPSLADLAARVGSDETRLGRTIVRINTIESTSPLASAEALDGASLPPVLAPAESPSPEHIFQTRELRDRVRLAIASLPPRERKVIGLYYYGDATMKKIGAEIGVNESRVSQLHARAIQRLRNTLAADLGPQSELLNLLPFKRKMVRVDSSAAAARVQPRNGQPEGWQHTTDDVVVDYASVSRAARSRSASRNGFASQRQPLSSRNRSASVPATSPVTKMIRRASSGSVAAIAR